MEDVTSRPLWPLIQRALRLLPERERREFNRLGGIVFLMATLEVAGVLSVLPFISVISNPDLIQTHPTLVYIADALDMRDSRGMTILLALTALFILVIGNGFRIWGERRLLSFVYRQNHRLSHQLLAAYLKKSHLYFKSYSTADLVKNVTTEINEAITGIYVPIVNLFSRLPVVALFLLLLLFVDSTIALLIGGFLAVVFYLMYAVVRKWISTEGRNRFEANRARFRITNESLLGASEIRLYGKESYFLERFDEASGEFARASTNNAILHQVPRLVLELVAFGSLMLLVILMLLQERQLDDVLPMITLYAFAGYRLLPSTQIIFSALSHLRFSRVTLEEIERGIGPCVMDGSSTEVTEQLKDNWSSIEVAEVSFSYSNRRLPALAGFSMSIAAGDRVALAGPTGVGKSTLLDMVSGLLSPDSGAITIDDVPIARISIEEWHRQIAYVPQNSFLLDASIAENIVFGSEFDAERLQKVLELVQLADFVDSTPSGVDTIAGDRGVSISGGQRQRIALARALYREPRLLLMDEATSALDEITEAQVLDGLFEHLTETTIVYVAHRSSAVNKADKVIEVTDVSMPG